MFISTVIARLQTVDAISGLKHARVAGKARGARDRGSVTFWGNANRFNVAISRARCLLVVVGHPAVLSHDAMWSKFLW